MPDQMPPPRRRPTGGAAPSELRPVRRSGVQRAVASVQSKLICTAGPKAGTEFPLTGEGEQVIGRATDNAISIPDTSVSRKHCSVRRAPEGWLLSDLGSGNGTLVNGEPIEVETLLRSGDVITIGDTELGFADLADTTAPGAPVPVRSGRQDALARSRPVPSRVESRARSSRVSAPALDPAEKARKRKLVLIGAAGAVVILGGLAVAKVVLNQKNAALDAQQQQHAAQLDEVRSIFQEGKNLVRDGKWADAKAKFEQVIGLDPNYPTVTSYLERTNVEIPNQQHLEAAEAALEKNQLAEAAVALGKVTQDTQQFEKQRDVKARLEKKLDERLAEAAAAKAAAAYDQAVAITEDILRVWPEHRDASVLNADAKAAIERANRPQPTVKAAAPKPWLEVVARYVDGDMSGALALADQCAGSAAPCRSLAAKIRQFAELYKKVESLDANGLSKLLELDRDISGGQRSKMARAAGTRAAGMFYKNAAAAKSQGHWGRAQDWAKKALQADPGHPGAKGIAEEARTESRNVYLAAYGLKDTSPDEAVVKFRDVLKMTSPGDEYYDKAKHWIEKLDR